MNIQFVQVEFLHQHLGHGLVQPPIHADADVQPTDCVTHGSDVGQGEVDFFEGIEVASSVPFGFSPWPADHSSFRAVYLDGRRRSRHQATGLCRAPDHRADR